MRCHSSLLALFAFVVVAESATAASLADQERVAIGKYIEARRSFDLRVALGGMNEREKSVIDRLLAKAGSGKKLSRVEYESMRDITGDCLPFTTALSVDWSTPERKSTRKAREAFGIEDDGPKLHRFARELSGAIGTDRYYLLIYDREAKELMEPEE